MNINTEERWNGLTVEWVLFFWFLLIIGGCTQGSVSDNTVSDNGRLVKYAEKFRIETYDNYTHLAVINPWKGASRVTYNYITYQGDRPTVTDIENPIFVKTPLRNLACLSTTHTAILSALDAQEVIAGVSGSNFLYDSLLYNKVKAGTIKDIGNESGLNYELLIAMQPAAILTYGIGGPPEDLQQLNDLGLHPIIVGEYIEVSPLARAEWIKFFGVLLGKLDLATATFEAVEKSYLELAAKAQQISERPAIFCGTSYQGTWFMPGGKSFVAQYIADAGGNYLWSATNETSSLELDFEAVFAKAYQADKWIDIGVAFSKKDMLAMDNRYDKFKAYQEGEVYNYSARISPNGGFDIYESGVVNPHLVLKDFIIMIHPTLMADSSFEYYQQLE